jgi:hypothetical protein
VDSKGNAVICWERGGWEIWFCKVDRSGNFAIRKTHVNPGAVDTPTMPKVVVDSKDDIHIFYLDCKSKDRNIHYVKYSSQGNLLVKNRIVGRTGYSAIWVGADIYNAVATPSGDIYLMWYARDNNTWGAGYARLDSSGNALARAFLPGFFGLGSGFVMETVGFAFSMDMDSHLGLHLVWSSEYRVLNTTAMSYTESNWTSGGDVIKVDKQDGIHVSVHGGYARLDSNGLLVHQGPFTAIGGYPIVQAGNEYLYLGKNGAADSSGDLHLVEVEKETEIRPRDTINYYTIYYSRIDIASQNTEMENKIIDSDRGTLDLSPEKILVLTVLIVVPTAIVLQVFIHRRRKRKALIK